MKRSDGFDFCHFGFFLGLHSSKQQILKIVLQQNMTVYKMSIITIKCCICTDAAALLLHSQVSMETSVGSSLSYGS